MYLGYCQKWSDGSVSQHQTIGECRSFTEVKMAQTGTEPIGEPWVAGFDEPTFMALSSQAKVSAVAA